MRMVSMRESRDSDRFLVNTQVQSHALLRRGFGTAVPFIALASGVTVGIPELVPLANLPFKFH